MDKLTVKAEEYIRRDMITIINEYNLECSDFGYCDFENIFITTKLDKYSDEYYKLMLSMLGTRRSTFEGFFYSYFTLRESSGIQTKTLESVRRLIIEYIYIYDYAPTDDDFEDCISVLKEQHPRFYGVWMKDIIKTKYDSIKAYYYSAIKIIHNSYQ